ncbi:nitronate monooxygenase [Microbacterium sp. 2MCAF23]|uniref:nitronate monooxygenase n=1 Tax=Microbacterium sp. 2MCAF23 TaxID=3232985 RepID=UPI003F9A57BB
MAEALDLETPIFAFSHCGNVVAAVTKAGGLGVLGAAWMTPEELGMSIESLEGEADGKPFGVDLVFPGTGGDEKEADEYLASIPPSYMEIFSGMPDRAGLTDVFDEDRDVFMMDNARKMAMTNEKSARRLRIPLAHPTVHLIVGALGVTCAVGQVIGDRRRSTTVRSEMARLIDQYIEALEARTSMG